MTIMTLDRKQGITENNREFGYVCGDDGGWFFTWCDTLAETLDSIEIDTVDGDGGLSKCDVREFLATELASDFDE